MHTKTGNEFLIWWDI